MNNHITADHLVDAASKAVTEELFRNFNNTLQSFCDEERDRVVLFRTLRSTRIRLSILRKYLPDEEVGPNKTRSRFLDIAIGYINTELELLRRYDRIRDLHTKTPHRWTGTIVGRTSSTRCASGRTCGCSATTRKSENATDKLPRGTIICPAFFVQLNAERCHSDATSCHIGPLR